MVYDNIVVGSGISSLGCIIGLLESNKKVLCIDASDENVNHPNKENSENIVFCKQKLPLKNFRSKNRTNKIFKPLEVLESQSFGGLLNIWGGNCLRFSKDDFEDWPISYDDLKKYYQFCEKIMNVSHYNDDLSNELEINNNQKNDTKLNFYSGFIKSFIKKYYKNDDYSIGYSRIAINEKHQAFNTREHIDELIKENKIEYIKNLILEKL